MRRAAAFSGIEQKALVAMDNHFHVVCKVVRGAGSVPREEIVRRVAILKGSAWSMRLRRAGATSRRRAVTPSWTRR